MAQVEATTERIISADAETVFDALADYKDVRGKVLTAHFSEYEVREGGDGEGTLVHWKLQATSKRVRDCLLEVTEPTDGQLVEKDRNSSMVTTWTVTPAGEGGPGPSSPPSGTARAASAASSSGPSPPRASAGSTTSCSRTSPPRSRSRTCAWGPGRRTAWPPSLGRPHRNEWFSGAAGSAP